MWATVLFALLVATASAEYGWKPNSEYRYEVHSKTLASLNQLADLYTGVIMRAQVVIIPKTSQNLIVKIPQAEYSHVEANFPQGPEHHIPQEYLKYQVLPLTKQPFEVKLKNGVVDEIVVSKDVPIWEVNVIKSIVSQLQVDTQGQRLIPSKLNMVPHDENEVTAVYKIMEDTIEGECEVLYDITPLPKYVLQRMPYLVPQPQLVGQGQYIDIVKTKNFTNCQHRPGYHFGFTGLTQWEPTANRMGNFLSRSSVSRVVVSGNLKSYTIQSSVTTNKVILSPEIYNSQKGEVFSRVNLTLSSVHSSQGEQQGCQNPQTIKKLVYDFNSPWTNDQEARNRWDQTRGTSRTTTKGGISSPSSVETHEGSEKYLKRNRRSMSDSTYKTINTINPKKQFGSSESSEESMSQEEWHQDTPTMTHAPESPFLPYFVGYMGHSIQHSKEVNVNQIVKKLSEEIGDQLEEFRHLPEKNTLDRFTMLTKVVQTMNVKQLQQATKELYVKTEIESDTPVTNRNKAWMTFRDAVVQAGTGPAFMIIKEWILNDQIHGEEAAQVIATLPKTVVYPTSEYMKNFFELVKNPQVLNQEYLNTSMIFAFTRLVRMAQVDRHTIHNRYPVHTFGRFTPKEDRVVADQYIPYFAEKLEHAIQEEDSPKIQLYIRALGNTAHPKILRVFEPYLEGKKPMTVYQRTLVVVTLVKLARVHPRLARSVLYKTYANVGEAYQVRVAAVYNLMKTNPPVSMLQRMAQFTHEDPSYQVSSAVKSAIKSYATFTGKNYKQECENARSAVNLLTTKEFGLHYSHANFTNYIVKGFDLGYTQFYSSIGGQNGLLPESVFYHLTRNINGYKYITNKFSGMISSVSVFGDLLDDLVDSGEDFEGKNTGSDKRRENVENIYKTLNLEQRFNKQLEGNVLFEWLGVTRLVTFDNHTVEAAFERLMALIQRCQTPRNFNYQTIYNELSITVGMPTASGFPFVYTLNTPTLVYLSAKVGVKVQPQSQSGKFILPDAVAVDADVALQYSTRIQSKISFITPFDHQHYIAGMDKNLQVVVPFKTKVGLDLKTTQVKVQIVSLDENKEYNLFHYSVWPYISRHNILEFKPIAEISNTHRIKIRNPIKFSEKIGEETGLVLLIQGSTEKRYFDFKTLYDFFESHTMQSFLAYPVYTGSMEHTIIDVVLDPKVVECKSILFTASCIRNLHHTKEEKTSGTGSNLAKPTQNGVNSPERLQEFSQRVKTGIKEAESMVVDLGVEMQGGKPVQYVATFAYASSPVDVQTRVLAYLHQMSSSKKYEICVNGLTQMQSIPMYSGIKSVETEPKSGLRMEISYGEQCQQTQVEIVGKFTRTPERKHYIQQLPVYNQAKNAAEKGYLLEPSQTHIANEAQILDNYHFVVKYQQLPVEMKNVTYKVYSILRHAFFYYVSENPFEGKTQEGQAEMIAQFTPDLKSLTCSLHTPAGATVFKGVRVPRYLSNIVTPRRVQETWKVVLNDLLKGKYYTTCNIDHTQVRTFSNLTYPMQTDKVWHVAMITKPQYNVKHVAGEVETYRKKHVVTALVREVQDGQKQLKLILDYPENIVVEVVPEQGDKVLISINGEKRVVSAGKVYTYEMEGARGKKFTLVRYYQMPTGEVVLSVPQQDIVIFHLGKSIQINLGPKNMNKVTGFCGTRDGERYSLVTPQGYILKDYEQFFATWALSDEGRISELKKAAQENSKYKRTIIPSNVVSEQDAGRANFYGRKYENLVTSAQDYDSSSSESKESLETARKSGKGPIGCNTRRIVSVEQGDKHCFSLYPEPACTSQCHPEETEKKTGQFYCVEKSSTSEHWQKMIARGANPDFRNKGNTEEITFEYPVKCSRN